MRKAVPAVLILASGLSGLAAPEPNAARRSAGDGDYVIRIEAPFSGEAPAWLPLRVSVKVKDGKPVDAFATAMQLNVAWHPVDLAGLRLENDAFVGELKVQFRRDDFQAADFAAAEKKAAAGRPHKDMFAGFSSQAIKIKCPVGTVTGPAPGEATAEKDLLHWQARKPPAAKARAFRDPAPDAHKPRYVELQIIRWAEDARAGTYDTMYGNASVLVRCAIRDGKSEGFVALQGPERYQFQYADLAWRVPEGALQLADDTLSGELTLAPTDDATVREVLAKSHTWRPLPAQPLRLKIDAKVIGSAIAGAARIAHGGATCESSLTGRVRSFPFALHADRTPRSWSYTAEPDPALVEAARKEALIPIRPGEPGKREFWSDGVRFGGCDFFVEDGKRIVQFDWHDPADRMRKLVTLSHEDYRAKKWGSWAVGAYHGITPPSLNLATVPGAAAYRFTVDVVPPPKPLPVIVVPPDAAYQPGKDVPVEALVPGRPPLKWIVSDAVSPLARDDFLAGAGGSAKYRPESGAGFKVAGKDYAFRPMDARHVAKSGEIAVLPLMKQDNALCLYTVLRCDEPRWVRLNHGQVGRGGTQSFLAGQEVAGGRILKLSPGLYPWLVVVRMWGHITSITPRFEEVKESEVAEVERAIAAPPPQFPRYSAEVGAPWKPLTELWQRLPRAAAQAESVTMEALDAAGKPVGEPVKIPLTRYPSFAGPYFKLPRTYRDAALMSARWMRDHPVGSFARAGVGIPGVGGAGGDGQLWYTNYSSMYAGLIVHQLSDDPAERAEALEAAVATGDTWLRSFMANYLPDTYKGWLFDQWVYGTSWLDLYRLTGDPRYRDAVMLHARRIVDRQLPTGAWPGVEPTNGRPDVDPKTGRPFMISLQGPSMQQWDPSSTLYYLGRIRKELKADDFREAEEKAYRGLMDNGVARFDWRKQGPHASEDHKMPWLTLPDCALHFFNYLALDLPGRAPDWELMGDLLRWSEDRDVDWRRMAHPTSLYPRVIYTGKNRDTQMRLAAAYAVHAKHTGNPLHRAKAEALAGACLVAQFPTTGQIPHYPDIDTTLRPHPGYSGPGSGDGGNRGEYATMALMALSRLLESK